MVEHDALIGEVLDSLDKMGIADNTIVIYTTDNGPQQNSWPDAGTTPFRSQKNTNWEGAFRVPAFTRWPGHTKRGSIDGNQYKNHLDGFNQLPYLTGKADKSAGNSFIYFNDDGDIVALRYENWKMVFAEQRAQGTLLVWSEPFTNLRVPKMFELRSDPYERANVTSNTYWDWVLEHAYLLVAGQAEVGKFLATFKDYPPAQRAASFSIDQIQEKMKESFNSISGAQ